jgi:hypothetical protein
LGFKVVEDHGDDGYAVMICNGFRLALYQGHIAANMLNFRGGDVAALAAELKRRGLSLAREAETERDGSVGATLIDPDGNVIYLNTTPAEATAYVTTRRRRAGELEP